jgi:hypothetical protein
VCGFEKEDRGADLNVGLYSAGRADHLAPDQPLDCVDEWLAESLFQHLSLLHHCAGPAVREECPFSLREASLEHTDDQVIADVRSRLAGPLSDVLLVQTDY